VPEAVCLLAAVELDLGDLPGATASCDRALALARTAGHRPTEARVLCTLSQILMVTDPRAAQAAARHAADLLAVTGAAAGPAPHGPRR
jgi:hypothetical protein